MIYAVLAILAAIAAAVLALPLLRRPHEGTDRTDAGIDFYRSQLAELDADEAEGLVSADEAAAARIEIKRRLLRAAEQPRGAATGPASPHRRLAVLLVVSVLGASFIFYLSRGNPGLEDHPAPDASQLDADHADIDTLITRLAARMEEHPDALDGWLLLGRNARAIGRFDLAVNAFQHAVALEPQSVDHKAALAEALVAQAAGLVTPEARALFEQVTDTDPANPVARYYLAMAAFQARNFEAAYDGWSALAADIPPDTPLAGMLQQDLSRAARHLGIEPPVIAAPEAPKGPSAADMQAAAGMTDEERNSMIRGMVEGLAAKMEQNPDDLAGWLRLGRAYTVLGETAKAKHAYEQVLRLDPGNSDALEALGAPVSE